MSMLKYMSVLSAASLLSGCISNANINDLDTEGLAKLSALEVYEGAIAQPYESLGVVKGLSCKRTRFDPEPTHQEALDGIKLNAAQMEADAIINLNCQARSTIDWSQNCTATVLCVGEAIQVTQ